jgi:hypothetical protein
MSASLLGPILGGLAGGLAGKGGKTSVSQQSNSTNQATQTANFALSNNPTVALITGSGAGVAPAVSGQVSTPSYLAPSVSAPANLSNADGTGSGYLPRYGPTGSTGLGAGFTSPGTYYQTPQDQLLLMMLLIGGAALLLMNE